MLTLIIQSCPSTPCLNQRAVCTGDWIIRWEEPCLRHQESLAPCPVGYKVFTDPSFISQIQWYWGNLIKIKTFQSRTFFYKSTHFFFFKPPLIIRLVLCHSVMLNTGYLSDHNTRWKEFYPSYSQEETSVNRGLLVPFWFLVSLIKEFKKGLSRLRTVQLEFGRNNSAGTLATEGYGEERKIKLWLLT